VSLGTNISGTMISVEVDPSDRLPLHEQVAAEIRRAIAEGEASPGDRLSPARYLAEVLGVNHNTVIRALHTLRDEGILEFRRGRGITVAGDGQGRSALMTKAQELVKLARRQGYRHDELVALIEDLR
jgi:GntR family transcriptional regulator